MKHKRGTKIVWISDPRKGKQKQLLEGKIEVTRQREKLIRTWASDMMDWCSMSYTKCVRVARNSKEWRSW